jgi:hypothetical protein
MKHDWNTWLKNRVLREARHKGTSNFKFKFEEEELQVGPHLVDVKFTVNADHYEEEPMVRYGDNPYPGSPAYWDWQLEKILEVHPEGLNIPEKEIIDSLKKRLDNSEMQERLSDEADEQSPEPDYYQIDKDR